MNRDPQEIARLLVRMHYDPDFAAKIAQGLPVRGVSQRACELARSVDLRAFRTDPLRPIRTLHALIEEFPVASAVVEIPCLRLFFAHPLFHESVMQRKSLALAYGDYLATLREARELARLELMIARLRRSPTQVLAAGQISLGPGVATIFLKGGTLETYQTTYTRLGPRPVDHVIAHAPLRVDSGGQGLEYIYAQAGRLGRGSKPLHQLLSTLEAGPFDWTKARLAAIKAGSSPAQAEELLEELIADGLLVRG